MALTDTIPLFITAFFLMIWVSMFLPSGKKHS